MRSDCASRTAAELFSLEDELRLRQPFRRKPDFHASSVNDDFAEPLSRAEAPITLAGLPAPSVVRTAKIATIDSRDAVHLGRVSAEVLQVVQRHLDAILRSDDSKPRPSP